MPVTLTAASFSAGISATLTNQVGLVKAPANFAKGFSPSLANGSLADQASKVYYRNAILTAQADTIDLTALIDFFGNPLSFTRLVAILLLNNSTIDGANLVLGGAVLAPPAAPAPTTATTGGTVAAGAYGVIVSYTNAAGETLGSTAGTVTTTGTTSTITVPSPPAIGSASGWYAYVTQAGGSTYTRQQTAGSPSAIGAGLTITAPPTNTGAAPPAANTASNAPVLIGVVAADRVACLPGTVLNGPGVLELGGWNTTGLVVSPTAKMLRIDAGLNTITYDLFLVGS